MKTSRRAFLGFLGAIGVSPYVEPAALDLNEKNLTALAHSFDRRRIDRPQINRDRAAALANSARITRERHAARVFNSGFST